MDLSWFPLLVLAIDWTIRIALAIHVIMRGRPVSVSLAWLAVVLFIPVVGLLAYLLVGENRLGRSRLRRAIEIGDRFGVHQPLLLKHKAHEFPEHDESDAAVSKFGEAVCGVPALAGNQVELITDSDQFLERLVADIDASTSSCHILTYIWSGGDGPTAVGRALIRASGRGVRCRVLADGVGCSSFLKSALAEEMRRGGVSIVAALPVSPVRALFQRLDLRNHRKISVIDGRIAYTGSQNITDSTFGVVGGPKRGFGPWIDASVRVVGPAARALQFVFLRDWELDSQERIDDLDPLFPPLPEDAAGSIVQLLPSGPGSEPRAIHDATLTAIYSASQELIITTPYFVPDDATRSALSSAARRGVEVTLVVPRKNDARLVAGASRSNYHDLLKAGVRIRLFRGGLLHAKTMSIDRHLAIIGSANFDMRSFWLNFEITLIAYDTDFAGLLRFAQMGYVEESDEVVLEDWDRRPRHLTFCDNACQLLGPLL